MDPDAQVIGEQTLNSPPKYLVTDRLVMRASTPALAEATIDYQQRNLAHFARWDPTRPADH